MNSENKNYPAHFASFLFHPVFMPVLGLILIFNSGIYATKLPVQYLQFIYSMALLCNVILPLSIIPVLIYLRHLQDVKIDDRRERLIPLFFATICFYMSYHIISRISPLVLANLFLLSAAISVFIVLFISIFWKISLHTAGLGGILGLITIISRVYHADLVIILSAAILVSGIIATSRLALRAHTISQILAGFTVGFVVTFGLLWQHIQ
jgi:membrane-associated phospholipid phosphatase